MEEVNARTAQVGLLAYALGGGFGLFKALDDYVFLKRHPLEQYELNSDVETKPPLRRQAEPRPSHHPPKLFTHKQLATAAEAAQQVIEPAPRGHAVREAFRFAGHEAWRSAKLAMAFVAITQSVALARHGRYGKRFHNFVDDPIATVAGGSAAAMVYLDHAPLSLRWQKSLVFGSSIGLLNGLRMWYLATRESG